MNRNRNFCLMCMISFLQGLVFYAPIDTLYRQSRGLSLSNMFLIESIFMILMIGMEILWGHFADRFGYKITLIIGNLLFFISKIVFYRSYGFGLFLLERIFLALSV